MLLQQSNYEVWADELESKAESSQKGEDKRVYGTGVEVLHGNGDQGKVAMLLQQSNYEVWADELESKAESSQKDEDMPGALPWPVLLCYCSTWHLHCSLKSICYHNSLAYLIRQGICILYRIFMLPEGWLQKPSFHTTTCSIHRLVMLYGWCNCSWQEFDSEEKDKACSKEDVKLVPLTITPMKNYL